MMYSEAMEYLHGLGRFGLRPGLETVRALSARCGHPESNLRFLHVAGTNGKGSTCAFLESICRESGLRVGLYTSPHLVSFRERIQVNREQISEAAVAEWVSEACKWVAEGSDWTEAHPTFFEMVTVMALAWFARQRCDVVVWETGMGGRLDATNLVIPLVSAITNIGWDHMEWLGPTLTAIAGEKAGIIKPGVPVVTTEVDPEVVGVLRRVADGCGAPFRQVDPDAAEWAVYRDAPLSLYGAHQQRNAVLAVAAMQAAGVAGPMEDSEMLRGLQRAEWPGRFQILRRGGRTIVLDGAHNRPGFEVLARAMAEKFPGQRYGLLVGMLADKDPAAVGEHLVPGASRVVVVRVASNRAGDPASLQGICRTAEGQHPVEVASTLADAWKRLSGEGLVLVTGSLYLIGEAMEFLGEASGNERPLNDWSPRN